MIISRQVIEKYVMGLDGWPFRDKPRREWQNTANLSARTRYTASSKIFVERKGTKGLSSIPAPPYDIHPFIEKASSMSPRWVPNPHRVRAFRCTEENSFEQIKREPGKDIHEHFKTGDVVWFSFAIYFISGYNRQWSSEIVPLEILKVRDDESQGESAPIVQQDFVPVSTFETSKRVGING